MAVLHSIGHNQHVFEIGPSLREARTKRGLSAEDVQKAIRIRGRYLNALEDESWDLLPGDAYTKGFLRTYAEFLGLNGTLYVDEFNSRFARHEEEPFVPEAIARGGATGIGVLRPLVAIAAIVAVVAAVAAWKLHGSSTGRTPAAQPTAAAATKPAARKASAPAKHAARRHAAPAVAAHAVLTAARGPVWLLVRAGGATGRVLYQGMLAQGSTLPLRLAPTVWVRVGAPWNLDVRVGGRLVSGLPPGVGNIVLSARGLAPA